MNKDEFKECVSNFADLLPDNVIIDMDNEIDDATGYLVTTVVSDLGWKSPQQLRKEEERCEASIDHERQAAHETNKQVADWIDAQKENAEESK